MVKLRAGDLNKQHHPKNGMLKDNDDILLTFQNRLHPSQLDEIEVGHRGQPRSQAVKITSISLQ